MDFLISSWKVLVSRALTRPFQIFFKETIIQVFGIYMAFIYGLLYRTFSYFPLSSHPLIPDTSVFLTSMPGIFKGVYGQSLGISGLHYIALALGITIGVLINSMFMDKIYMYFRRKNGGESKPEFRLRTSI